MNLDLSSLVLKYLSNNDFDRLYESTNNILLKKNIIIGKLLVILVLKILILKILT
jgi:hypothetical protein